MTMTSSKPYLFRATVEWIEDNGLTPHIVVDANVSGVVVPQEYVEDGEIVLNISTNSIKLYTSNNDEFSFSASFSGRYTDVFLPMNSIRAVFARENQQGMFFNERAPEAPVADSSDNAGAIAGEEFDHATEHSHGDEEGKRKKPTKKPSHLKVIK